jgi:HD-like signal output (HDOD) protein
MADLAHFFHSVKLPVMPEVAQALIRTLNDPDADVTTVTHVIAKDPALTASLLRIANSALFGLSRSVSSLDSAVSVVGMSQIRVRALSICIANAFRFPPNLSRLEFWRSSMVCAGYAKWLAGTIGLDEHEAWLTGMMLRLGELVIAQRNPDLLEAIERHPCDPGERWTRERSLAGFDECQITAELARRWDFPADVTQALDASSQPLVAAEFSRLGAVAHLAALLSESVSATPETLDELPVAVVQALGLDLDTLKTHMPSAESFSDISMLPG